MELISKKIVQKKDRPVKVLQFGEGNFLRAFADHMIDIANEKNFFDGNIVIVKPRPGSLSVLREQDCVYTVQLRGIVDGTAQKLTRTVSSVSDAVECCEQYEKYISFARSEDLRFVISNTTEAGIVYDPSDRLEMQPPKSFPGKLCQLLYERFKAFDGATDKGLIMLPAELIDNNGKCLKECVLKLAKDWKLGEAFEAWVENACIFASTLVDRIVAGYPADEAQELFREFGYEDKLLVTGEPFALWVIESEKDFSAELPLDKAGLPVLYTDNLKPYKQRKVRILNGAHTSFVLASFLCGNDYVLESMEDARICSFIQKTIYEEVIPTLDLPKAELEEFAEAVFTRFRNPYVKHALLAISMNSVSKWRARCLPSLKAYLERKGKVPENLAFSLSALLAFYTGSEIRDGVLIGKRGQEEYPVRDDREVLAFFAENSGKDAAQYAKAALQKEEFWGEDLTAMPGLLETVTKDLQRVRELGMKQAM